MAVNTIASNWKTYHASSKLGISEQAVVAYTTHGATDDGEWFDASGAMSITVSVGGASPSGTVTMSGSNGTNANLDIPADTADGAILGTVAPSGTELVGELQEHELTRYIKVHLSAFTSGTLTVLIKMVKRNQ